MRGDLGGIHGCDHGADGTPQERAGLSAVNAALARYLQDVASVRSLNRQNLLVGAAFLQQASGISDGEITAPLGELFDREIAAAEHDLDQARSLWWPLGGCGLFAGAVLVAAMVWLARRTRRVFNVPLAAGSVLILGAIVSALLVGVRSNGRLDDVRTRPLEMPRALADVRLTAFQARTAENLTLVRRGSGAAYERAFGEAAIRMNATARTVSREGIPGGTPLVAQWQSAHDDVRELDDAGQWEKAVDLATGDSGALTRAFAGLDSWSAEHLGDQAERTAAA